MTPKLEVIDHPKPAPEPTYDGLQNVASALGTSRDKRVAGRYVYSGEVDSLQLEAMYAESWLAAKIVDAVAEDMTRAWRQVMFDDDTATARDSQMAVETEERRLSVPDAAQRALKWARLYGGSVVLLAMRDGRHDQPLDVERVRRGDLQRLIVFDRTQVQHDGRRFVEDLASIHFGEPEAYQLTAAGRRIELHHTRCLRFEGRVLPPGLSRGSAGWGGSVLQPIFEAIRDKDSAMAGVSTMVAEANVDVISTPGLADILSTERGEAIVTRRIAATALLKSIQRVLVLDGEEKYDRKPVSFAGLPEIIDRFALDVCGAADIPATRLFGRAPAGLNATGEADLQLYYDRISALQHGQLSRQMDRLDEVLLRSVFGSKPADFRYEWRPLREMSEAERATVQKMRADTDAIYLDKGVVTEGLVARELKERGTYATMGDADVQLAAELAEASFEHALEPPAPAPEPVPPQRPDLQVVPARAVNADAAAPEPTVIHVAPQITMPAAPEPAAPVIHVEPHITVPAIEVPAPQVSVTVDAPKRARKTRTTVTKRDAKGAIEQQVTEELPDGEEPAAG